MPSRRRTSPMLHSNLNPVPVDFDAQALRARVAGDVVTPADEAWDEARQAWNLAVDQRPVAVVLAESAAAVPAPTEPAPAAGWPVAPQGTGHNATPPGDLAAPVLLKPSAMRRAETAPEPQP